MTLNFTGIMLEKLASKINEYYNLGIKTLQSYKLFRYIQNIKYWIKE